MKQNIFFLISICACCVLSTSAFAQAPQKMSYQAVIRNASNALVTNQSVTMRISILQGSAVGTAVYVEAQGATTNANGLVSIQLGSGAVLSGNFPNINWGNGIYFIKTETDPFGGSNYTITSTSQFLSVPYALYAESGGSNGANGLTTTGDSTKLGGRMIENTSISQDGFALTLKDIDGTSTNSMVNQTSFSPSFNLSSTPVIQSFTGLANVKLANIALRVLASAGSSITLTLKNNAGTILGSQTMAYASLYDNWQTFTFSNNILLQSATLYNINISGTAVSAVYYSTTNPYGAGSAGIAANSDFAFAVNYFVESPSLFVGNQQVGIGTATPTAKLDVAGKTKTTQLQMTSGAGVNKAMVSDISGNASWAVFSSLASGTLDQAYDFGSFQGAGRTILADSGAVKIAGQDGLLVTGTIGAGADVENMSNNPQLFFNPKTGAFRAGATNNGAWDQANLGSYSAAVGYNTKATSAASFVAGANSTASGLSSIALGSYAFATGDYSVALGNQSYASGYSSLAAGANTIARGDFSTALGAATIANGYATLAIGIANDSIVAAQVSPTPTTPLFIIGNGDVAPSNAMVVRKNGRVGLGNNANTYQLELNTNSAAKPASSTWTISSDRRLKTIDGQYTKGLNDILKLNTIRYHYNKNNPRKLPSDIQAYGFVAQELQEVFPEAVNTDEDGYLSVDLHPVLVAYINAFKDLANQNKEQQKQIDNLKSQLQELMKLIKK